MLFLHTYKMEEDDDGTNVHIPLANAEAFYETAARTRLLHLSSLSLTAIPADVFSLGASLVRLDLSYNRFARLPSGISKLSGLEQLWLNDNPYLAELPVGAALGVVGACVSFRSTPPVSIYSHLMVGWLSFDTVIFFLPTRLRLNTARSSRLLTCGEQRCGDCRGRWDA